MKIKYWLKRYGPAEVMGFIGAVSGGMITNILFGNSVVTALGGTWGENISYYGTVILKDLKKQKEKHFKLSFKIIIKLLRNLILEFGPAECFDSFLIRPFTLYIFPKILNNLPLGLIIGKFAADFIFYIPTIIAYELKNKFIKE
jgi:hypothetical protein